tara:strand:+ start:547 stop:1116 length:570 start_codon:yes stop_codon:yes gene_type:complete
MPVTISGNGTLTGVAVGGLPDGIVDTDMLAANAVTYPKKGTGSILQVVGNLNTGGGTSTTTNNAWVATYITDTITPVAANSKIVILLSGMGGYVGGSSGGYGNATVGWKEGSGSWNYLGDGTNGMAYIYNNPGQAGWWDANVSMLHTPSYTLSNTLTYTFFIRCTSNINPIAIGNGNSHSPIVLMEVAG